MKGKKWVLDLLCVLVLLTGVLAAVHLHTRQAPPEGAVLLTREGQTRTVCLAEEDLAPVSGTVVNGKGETRTIDAMGLPLSALTGTEGVFQVTVTADDEYSARIGAEELDRAYLIQTEEGSARLIVFGDENAKRDVKGVATILVE